MTKASTSLSTHSLTHPIAEAPANNKCTTVVSALTRLTTSPFKGQRGAPTYFRDVMYSMIRTQLRNLSIEQAQYVNKPTTEVYLDFVKANKLPDVSVELGNGARAHWLGDKAAKVSLVFLHGTYRMRQHKSVQVKEINEALLTRACTGGGYAQPMTPGHFLFFHDLIKLLNTTGSSINLVVLSYTLAPQAQYPTQLIQASSLLTHLLTHKPASDLIIAGDSAGGNLALGLLSHILHPHPSIPPIDLKGESLRGALLISPWVSFDTRHKSYERNAESDLFDAVPLTLWSKAFLGTTQRQGILLGDSYSEPLIAEPSWWKGADQVVKEVLIWGGGGEVFIDGINAFAEKFVEGWKMGGGAPAGVQVVERERACHEGMIVDVLLGYKEKGPGARDVEDFVRSKL